MTEPLSLRRKLFLAGKSAQEVDKNGRGDGFKYARAEDVFTEASRVLEKQGILVIPSVESVEIRFLRNGGGAIAKASMSFEVMDTKSEEAFTKKWVGTGFDSLGDKAAYTAQTGAKKYFLASLLGIPFGTDPEDDGEPDTAPSAEALHIAAEQDRAAEQPDIPKGQDSDHATEAPEDQASAEGIESEIPADTEGLD